jgi:hypothetical protein
MLAENFSFKNSQLKYRPNIGINSETCDINIKPFSKISLALIIKAIAVLTTPK